MAKNFSLKNLFFESTSEPGSSPTAAPGNAAAVKKAPPASVAPQPAPSPVRPAPVLSSVPNAELNPQIMDSLVSALESANQDGYDYFEFQKSLEQQKDLIKEEQIRFQSTNAAASVMGVTPQKLIDSAQQYRSVLSRKEKEFLDALDQNRSNEIDQKKTKVSTIEKELTEKAELINKITKEIGELQQSKQVLENEVRVSQEKIEKIRVNFYKTLQTMYDRIDSDVSKIKQYLLPGAH